MDISAAQVKAFRDKTGLSMMDCKKALIEAGGDEEKAIDILRKSGVMRSAKMQDRAASEGRIACFVDRAAKRGAIVELRCETAPVANTTDFIQLANLLAEHAAQRDELTPAALQELPLKGQAGRKVSDALLDVFNRLRENMQIARVACLQGVLGHYVHHNGQVGVLIEFSAECPEAIRSDVCMHVAAMNPTHLRREEVSPEALAHERALAIEEVKGKPPQIVDKIVAGKLDRWYSEFVLLEQAFVKDDKKSVAQALAAAVPGLTIQRYKRFAVGGS